MKNIKIKNKVIGEQEPCFVIAEAGVNHNGNLELAKKLVDVAKAAKCDAIKFQTFKPDRVVTKLLEKVNYQNVEQYFVMLIVVVKVVRVK